MSSALFILEQDVVPAAQIAADLRRGATAGAPAPWSNIPIPAPRPRVMAHIRDLLSVTSGQAIPLCFRDGAAIGGFRLPHLGPDEAATHGCRSTVDILLAHSHRWLLSYRLWQHYKEQDFWLVPTQGEGRSFRISHGLLALSPRAPFFCPYERNYGFELAAESLDARRGGY